MEGTLTMEQWLIPLLSAAIVVLWAVIWWLRHCDGPGPAHRAEGLDLLLVIVGVALFVSSLQYVSTDAGEAARIAVNALRIALFGSGIYVLVDQWRHDRAGL